MPPTNSTCDNFLELQSSPGYSVLIFARFFLCSTGTIFAAIQWFRRGVAWMAHANSKTLFTFYYAMVVFQGAAYAALYGFEFVRLRLPCFHHDFRINMVIRTLGTAGIMSSNHVMMLISFERLFSALKPKVFERLSDRYLPAFIAGGATVVVTFFFIFFGISDGFRLFSIVKEASTIDSKITENTNAFNITFWVLFGTNLAGAVLVVIDLYVNVICRKRAKNENLGANHIHINYQFAENAKVIATLLPLEITNSVLTLFAVTAHVVSNAVTPVNPTWSPLDRALYVEGTAMATFYPLLFALIIEWRARKWKKSTIADITAEQAQKHYFAELHMAWNVDLQKSSPKSSSLTNLQIP